MANTKYIADDVFLLSEWNKEKNENNGIFPNTITLGSSKKVWWTCSTCGYEWQAIPYNRKKGAGCPRCGKIKSEISKQKNRLAKNGSLFDWCCENGEIGRGILDEWDSESNLPNTPKDYSKGSGYQVSWKCSKGHKWVASISNRVRGNGCPICSNRIIIAGENDIKTTHEYLLVDWDYSKNYISPSELSFGSTKKVWWKCHICGNSWEASPNDRTAANRGCPFCAHHVVDSKSTSLAAQYPALADEWCYELNGEKTPQTVFTTSKQAVWWKCSMCGNIWQASIGDRTRGSMCPKCPTRIGTSFPEQAIFYYIKQVYSDAIIHYTDIFTNSMELDIYIPSLKIGLEYDGAAWHTTREAENRERKKYEICQKNGICLIRIKENVTDEYRNYCDVIITSDTAKRDLKRIDRIIDEISEYVPLPIAHNCNADEFVIKSAFLSSIGEKSISNVVPSLLDEWDYEKNIGLSPNMFPCSSGQIVWWKCKNGHEWKGTIYNRYKGHGCPYCCNRRLLVGYNDLETIDPVLSSEWDYQRNDLTPITILASSNKKAWWKCSECGYSWETSVYNRHVKKTGCPACANNVIQQGRNDFATTHPDLLEEWDYQKNIDISPDMFVAGSTKKVWWKCNKGHSWSTEIRVRVRGNNCPVCANKTVLTGYNDFATVFPDMLDEWDYSKNIGVDPSTMVFGSHVKVWWKCRICGHEWEAALYSKASGRGCTKCANQYRGKRKIEGK